MKLLVKNISLECERDHSAELSNSRSASLLLVSLKNYRANVTFYDQNLNDPANTMLGKSNKNMRTCTYCRSRVE